MDVPHKLWMAYRALFLPWGCPMADKEHDMSSPNTNLTLEQHVLGISGKPLQRATDQAGDRHNAMHSFITEANTWKAEDR
jgi:hypothetical protein